MCLNLAVHQCNGGKRQATLQTSARTNDQTIQPCKSCTLTGTQHQCPIDILNLFPVTLAFFSFDDKAWAMALTANRGSC